MNPNCGLPPLVKRHTVRRRSSSSGPSVRGEGGGRNLFPGPSWGWGTLGVAISLSRCEAQFWSLRRLEFSVLSAAHILGPLGAQFFLVLSRARFLTVFSGPRFFLLVRPGLDFLVLSGVRLIGPTGTDPGSFGGSFPLSLRGLDLFWVRRLPEFHDPFRGCIAWSFWGTITYVAGPHYGQRVESCCWACLLFLFFASQDSQF